MMTRTRRDRGRVNVAEVQIHLGATLANPAMTIILARRQPTRTPTSRSMCRSAPRPALRSATSNSATKRRRMHRCGQRAARVVLTAEVWKDLVRVNRRVDDRSAGDRHGPLGRGREVVLIPTARATVARTTCCQAAHVMQAGWRREATADHRGRDKKGDERRGADGQDRQGRLQPRQPGGRGPALVGYRLPLRQASVAGRTEQLGIRSATELPHSPPPPRRAKTGTASRSRPTLPVPRPGWRAAGVPQRRPHLLRRQQNRCAVATSSTSPAVSSRGAAARCSTKSDKSARYAVTQVGFRFRFHPTRSGRIAMNRNLRVYKHETERSHAQELVPCSFCLGDCVAKSRFALVMQNLGLNAFV